MTYNDIVCFLNTVFFFNKTSVPFDAVTVHGSNYLQFLARDSSKPGIVHKGSAFAGESGTRKRAGAQTSVCVIRAIRNNCMCNTYERKQLYV